MRIVAYFYCTCLESAESDILPDIWLSRIPDIRQSISGIRPDTGYKKWLDIRHIPSADKVKKWVDRIPVFKKCAVERTCAVDGGSDLMATGMRLARLLAMAASERTIRVFVRPVEVAGLSSPPPLLATAPLPLLRTDTALLLEPLLLTLKQIYLK